MAYKNGHIPHNKVELNLEKIKEMYLQGHTAAEIAKHFGVTGCPIYTRLKKLGITRSNSECHKGIQSKEKNPNWKGGRHYARSGYVITTDTSGKLVREHRLIAEKLVGRKLEPHEIVHHKNGNGYDNRPENLQVFPSQSVHMKLHMTTEEASRRGSRKRALLAVMEVSE